MRTYERKIDAKRARRTGQYVYKVSEGWRIGTRQTASTKRRKRDRRDMLESRMRAGHVCGTCIWYGKNTHYLKIRGRDILPNECIQGSKTIHDPPRITSDNSPCILSWDLWRHY